MTTLLVNDERLECRVVGHGPTLVLVHANISDIRSWEPIEALLAENFRVINYSRRYAHPNRPIPAGADDPLEVHVEDLVSLIEAQAEGPVHLLGCSSGAFISLLVATRRPDLVASLSLEEPPVVSMFVGSLPPRVSDMVRLLLTDPDAVLAFAKFGARTMSPAVKAFQRGDDEAALDAFCEGVLGRQAYRRVTAGRRQQMLDNLAPHRAALLRPGLPAFTPAQARALTVPTQLIRGASTSHFQRRVNQRLAALVPGARDVVVGHASHLVHEDNPADVARAVLELAGRTGPAAGRHPQSQAGDRPTERSSSLRP
ncbi:alpha/beta fold hydrolase [Jannaschia sp. R86511]|uniref:alpha/beta fold hydrolase n=1 Tax=Jannaschia sp. R86511 TaxID=3093853 RepID=UPI0036D370E3